MTATASAPVAAPAPKPAGPPGPQMCAYCAGAGRWVKDVIAGKPPESVYCPHCHGSGIAGADLGAAE